LIVLAIYAGRFDPATNGHLDLVTRAARMFDELIVAVYALPSERSLFSTDERVEMFQQSVAGQSNIRVMPFTGLLTEFAREQRAAVLVRGIRAVTDFYAEFDQALMYKKMASEIEQVYLMSSLEHLFISATRIREVYALGYDVHDLVPPPVEAALREKFHRE
jgi:pantetheine-phosphate adenylyltransferase